MFIGYKDKVIVKIDNQAAVYAVSNDNFSSASKAYVIRTEKLKERFKTEFYQAHHIPGVNELPNVLTKPVTVKVQKKLIPLIMLDCCNQEGVLEL